MHSDFHNQTLLAVCERVLPWIRRAIWCFVGAKFGLRHRRPYLSALGIARREQSPYSWNLWQRRNQLRKLWFSKLRKNTIAAWLIFNVSETHQHLAHMLRVCVCDVFLSTNLPFQSAFWLLLQYCVPHVFKATEANRQIHNSFPMRCQQAKMQNLHGRCTINADANGDTS